MLKESDFTYGNPLDRFTYYSPTFSIVTKWDGKYKYTMEVFDERRKSLVETIEVEDEFNYWDFYAEEEDVHVLDRLDDVFEQTKTKYIFDRNNVLASSCLCKGKCANCARVGTF